MLDLSSSSTARTTLTAFLAAHGMSTALIAPRGPLTPDAKAAIVSSLVDAVGWGDRAAWRVQGWDQATVAMAMQCLKVLVREREGCDAVFCNEGLETIMRHAGLIKASDGGAVEAQGLVALEAMKCLVNLCLDGQMRVWFEKDGGVDGLVNLLMQDPVSLDTQFLAWRVLFLLTAHSPETTVRLTNLGSVALMKRLLHPLAIHISTSKPLTPGFANELMVASEIMKVLYNQMMDRAGTATSPTFLSPSKASAEADRKADRSAQYIDLLPDITLLLTSPLLNPSNPLSPPHSHAIHCLLNYPLTTSHAELWWDNTIPPGSSVDTLIDVLSLSLRAILPYENGKFLKEAGGGLTLGGQAAEDVLPPVLLVLRDAARGHEEARRRIAGKLIPAD
ncbi:Synembryn-A, partial [Irineochytrium annulatum]